MKKIQLFIAIVTLILCSVPTEAAKKVHTIGDSTMANYDESATATRGWCQYLQQFLTGIEVNNRGKAGASSKSFYRETAFWTSVKKQMSPGDYVIIQFSHNDEKNSGMDGDELKAYYNSIGDAASASAIDYRGTNPSTTYKEYLRKYVSETREAGCIPILVAPVCRMYFSGNAIRRNGRHDLGDNFSRLTDTGILTGQKVNESDHSMDYTYQMNEVAKEMNVTFIDLTTSTANLYLSYGDTDCHKILSDGDGSTHLNATGAALIARQFVQICREAGIFTEYANLTSDLNVSPATADLGEGYKGQNLSKEFIVTGFDLTPSEGILTITTDGKSKVSIDLQNWGDQASIKYNGGTIIGRFTISLQLEDIGLNSSVITIKTGDKEKNISLSATAIELGDGTEVSAYWRLENDDKCVTSGPVSAIPESWHSMILQRYANPNANTIWPDETGFEATRKTQRNLIEGEVWPEGEIDEVSTRYIEFGIKAMPETTLKIDEISYYMCGCGGNGMCVHVYYSTEDDFSNPTLIYSKEKMPANNMLDGKIKPVITLEGGKSLRLRFYPWYNTSATGKTICLSDIKFHGWAVTNTDSSSLGKIDTDITTSETAYYSLQGFKVNNPDSGLYIVKKIYSDGSVNIFKMVF